MNDAIAVLNAGSSSIKFSLFAQRPEGPALVARGQAEGLYTAPGFVAKDGRDNVIDQKSRGEGTSLGHAGAPDHLVAFLRHAPASAGNPSRIESTSAGVLAA